MSGFILQITIKEPEQAHLSRTLHFPELKTSAGFAPWDSKSSIKFYPTKPSNLFKNKIFLMLSPTKDKNCW